MAITDKFANIANIAVTESSAGTITFNELKTGAGVFEKMAMVIHRIEYVMASAVLNLLIDAADALDLALVTSDQITTLQKDKAQVIDRLRVNLVAKGTPANSMIFRWPAIHDFSALPSGGLIVPATDLYLACHGTSLASAMSGRVSIYFTYKKLAGEEFWELVEATRALS